MVVVIVAVWVVAVVPMVVVVVAGGCVNSGPVVVVIVVGVVVVVVEVIMIGRVGLGLEPTVITTATRRALTAHKKIKDNIVFTLLLSEANTPSRPWPIKYRHSTTMKGVRCEPAMAVTKMATAAIREMTLKISVKVLTARNLKVSVEKEAR